MNILVLNYEFPPLGGGAAPVAREIAVGLSEKGHRVDVVTMGFRGLPCREELNSRLTVHRVPALRRKQESCGTLEMLSYVVNCRRYLKKLLKTGLEYDVCHCHFLIPTGLLVPWLRRNYQLKSIVTVHGSDVPGYNPDRFKLQHRITPPLIRSVSGHAHTIVTPSQYLGGLAANVVGKTPITHIPNGYHTSALQPSTKRPIILSSGRLLPRKGFQHLISAVRDHDTGYEIHICGDGPMMSELKSLAEGSRTPVVFHGWLDARGSAYRTLLSEASIYALVSSRENASVALLEAMSAGCAVVTANTSGCAETVGDAGMTVEPGNVQQIRNALLQLIGDSRLRQHLQTKAYERAMCHFDWKSIMQQYESLLSQVAHSSGVAG